jgi:membrane fusion protein (multidrug efflux system)
MSNTELRSKAPPASGYPGGDEEPHPQAGTRAYVVVRRGERRGDNKDGAKKATWYRRLFTGIALLLCGIAICSCSKGDNPGKAGQKPAVAVEATRVITKDLVEGVDVVGSLSPKFQADVKAEYPGLVSEVYVMEWVKVKKGTPLAKLDTRELELILRRSEALVEAAKANVLQAEVAENRANREYDRLTKLKEVGLVTQQNLDDAGTERAAAGAKIAAAKAQLKAAEDEFRQMQTRLSKAVITSPLNGVVAVRNVNEGDLSKDMLLFRVVDNRLLDLTVTVPSKETGSVRVGQPLTFSTAALPSKTFTGKITFINPAVNEADRSVKVVAEVPNEPEELKGGMFVKGRIVTGNRTGVMQIPRTGLITWDVAAKKAEVFVITGEQARRRPVQTGSVSGETVEVVTGLQAADLVVTRGGFNLSDGDRVKVTQANGG